MSVAQEIGSMNDAMMPRTVVGFHIHEQLGTTYGVP